VQQLAHRPQLSPRALYNCIVFLNQLRLHNRIDISPASNSTKSEEASPSLTVSLVNTYFRMFDVAIKKQQQSDGKCMTSRLLSALLTGINRARPFLPDKDQGLERHMDALYNVSHVAAPSASTQALMLLFHVAVGTVGGTKQSKENDIKQDRFYRALYSKLSHASFLGAGKHLTMFFNLLYKAMKYDKNSSRVLAFAKRLLCTVIHLNASIVNASLFLLNEVMKTHKNIEACFKNVPGNEENRLILDFTKREPLAAIVHTGGKTLEQEEIMPPLWEMCLISHHFHPSVDKFASSLGSIQYTGDPLRDFAVSPFLDKFAYKNPKTINEGNKTFAKRRFESKVSSKPVNDPAFLKKRNVDVADNFFQMFFLERSRRDEIKGISRKRDRDEDDDSISDASFDVLDEKKIEHLVSMISL
jgi:ribosome biogenesis protein MAK21